MSQIKRQITKETELTNQEKVRTLRRKGNLQVLGYIGSGQHQTSGDERKKI